MTGRSYLGGVLLCPLLARLHRKTEQTRWRGSDIVVVASTVPRPLITERRPGLQPAAVSAGGSRIEPSDIAEAVSVPVG
jgi:hypothetical protein